MASTYSTSLRLELMATGDQSGTWGDTTNTNLGTLLEQAITGVLPLLVPDANVTLTTVNGGTDQARNAVLVLTGVLTANRNVIVPAVNKLYVVINNTTGGFATVVKTSGGTGVNVLASAAQLVYCDGTNVVAGVGSAAPNATTAQYLANTPNLTLTTDQVNASGAFFGLTDAATVAWDMASGFNASFTIGGNRTLGNPTNATVTGRTGTLKITQDGTGGRTLAFASNWKFAGGVAVALSSAAGAVDDIFYQVQASNYILVTGIAKAVA